MADKKPWCKFWTSCLSDPDLEELELHQWARWARFIIFLRAHGENGKMRITPPSLSLQNVLRVTSYKELIEVLKLFKNVCIRPFKDAPLDEPSHNPSLEPSHEPSHESETFYFVSLKNWYKYQNDSSKKRMHKLRRKRTVTITVTPTVTRDALEVEESRSTTSTTTSTATSRATRSAPLGGAGATREHRNLPESERLTPEDFLRAKEEIVRTKVRAKLREEQHDQENKVHEQRGL